MKRMQLWPRGNSITFEGDDPDYVVQEENNVKRPATPEEATDINVETLAERYAERDILYCQSSLVDDLLRLDGLDGLEGFDLEDIEGLYTDPSDWTLEECRQYLIEYAIDYPDPDPWNIDAQECVELLFGASEKAKATDPIDDLREAVISNMDDGTIDGLDEWRQAVTDNAAPREVLEWWLVTSWLCWELSSIGEPIIDNDYGTWWGRTCSGQGVIMDGTLQKIAANQD